MKPFFLLILFLSGCANQPTSQLKQEAEKPAMELGNFSVSLAVKDIAESRKFYEKLGFAVRGGDQQQNWLVLQNGSTIIGLFQGMFEQNIMTFNPGWDNDGEQLPAFTDVRHLQKTIKAKGIKLLTETDESGRGPGFFMLEDPDGNQILIDQHVPAL
ncbi:VOC family protein [Aliiglaciecola sp. SL4]|uniref:VOC family protein n=1 Tax=Aliiglaciecola sp. SL4 TaxID=3239806 RepID=UPI00355C65F1